MSKAAGTFTHRKPVALAGALLLLAFTAPSLHAEDAAGLDLTMQVLGKDERVDDRLVNRIQIPGIGALQAGESGPRRTEAREERRETREENREARRERREETLERYRERRERPD